MCWLSSISLIIFLSHILYIYVIWLIEMNRKYWIFLWDILTVQSTYHFLIHLGYVVLFIFCTLTFHIKSIWWFFFHIFNLPFFDRQLNIVGLIDDYNPLVKLLTIKSRTKKKKYDDIDSLYNRICLHYAEKNKEI